MRLDKYLKVSRLVKRHVEVNGKVARASYEVKPDDIITVQMGANRMRAQVVSVQEYATKDSASGMYRLLNDT